MALSRGYFRTTGICGSPRSYASHSVAIRQGRCRSAQAGATRVMRSWVCQEVLRTAGGWPPQRLRAAMPMARLRGLRLPASAAGRHQAHGQGLAYPPSRGRRGGRHVDRPDFLFWFAVESASCLGLIHRAVYCAQRLMRTGHAGDTGVSVLVRDLLPPRCSPPAWKGIGESPTDLSPATVMADRCEGFSATRWLATRVGADGS